MEEAQSFVFNQLKKLPGFEQARFRELASATCMRQLVVNQLIASGSNLSDAKSRTVKPSNTNDLTDDFVLLDLAVRLQPEVPGLPEVLIAIATTDANVSEVNPSSLSAFVQRIINASSREGLSGILDAIRMAKAGDADGIAKAIARVSQDDTAYGMLATKIVMILVSAEPSMISPDGDSRQQIDHQLAIRWLKSITDSAPDLLSAWFARGSLHLDAKEFAEAIECFEYLAKRAPDSEQVQEMLDTARSM